MHREAFGGTERHRDDDAAAAKEHAEALKLHIINTQQFLVRESQ